MTTPCPASRTSVARLAHALPLRRTGGAGALTTRAFLLPTLATLLLLATPALATTLKVPSNFATIQAAIDAAQPGDTIQISTGSYVEGIVIPAELEGLTLVGKGKVWIEPIGFENGIRVLAKGVTLSKLGMRHASDAGLFAGSPDEPADGLRLEKMAFVNCGVSAITAFANDAVVNGCRLSANGGGVKLLGDDAVVRKTSITQDVEGIFIDGDRALVERNEVSYISSAFGIEVNGVDAQVLDNEVQNATDGLMLVSGSGAVVSGNVLSISDENALIVTGQDVTVSKNRASRTARGIYVASGAGARISGNRVSAMLSFGLLLQTNDALLRKNQVQDCQVGIDVQGNGNRVAESKIKDCTQAAIQVAGSDNEVADNRVQGSADDGICVGAFTTDTVVADNTVSGCAGEGFQNVGTDTRLRDNTFKKNRLDVTNAQDATLIDEGGNVFKTGGFDVEPEV